MNIYDYMTEVVFPAAFKMLPEKMDSIEARALIFSIFLQESRLVNRVQIGNGPAHGFGQFELAGIKGVLNHPSTRGHIATVLRNMGYDSRLVTSYEAIVHNDILAVCYARLLLWSSPKPLPQMGDIVGAWEYYVEQWRPGKPVRPSWDALYKQAWNIITEIRA
jgi:hypothetical protein